MISNEHSAIGADPLPKCYFPSCTEVTCFRHLFEQAPGFVAYLRGPDHVYGFVNKEYLRMVSGRDVIGKSLREALPELVEQGFGNILDQVYETGKPYVGTRMQVFLPTDQAAERKVAYVDFIYQPVRDDTGIVGVFLLGLDRTAQEYAEGELQLLNAKWKQILEATGEGVWEWCPSTNEVVFSPQWYGMLGYSANEFEQSVDRIRRLTHCEDIERLKRDVMDCFEGRTAFFSTEFRMRRKDGSWVWLQSRGMVAARDGSGRALRVIGSNIDITEKKEAEQHIWQEANFDPLTGLPNRRLFYDRLGQEILHSDRAGAPFALMFVDLDNFKQSNDLLGHQAGDLLLRQVADRIKSAVRQVDTVARLGGDEFTIILPKIGEPIHVDSIAQKVLEKLEIPFTLGDDTVYMSGSIGITLYPADAKNVDGLLNNADQAMYAAKAMGKNQFCYFTHQMQLEAQARLRLTNDLRAALTAGDQLCVYYQPVINLSSSKIVKAEALVRWFHPTMGLLYPTQFIEIAEESGLIHQLGESVFRQVAHWSASLMKSMQVPLQISINKSPVQFTTSRNEISWPKYLSEIGVPRHCIAIEITEGILSIPGCRHPGCFG